MLTEGINAFARFVCPFRGSVYVKVGGIGFDRVISSFRASQHNCAIEKGIGEFWINGQSTIGGFQRLCEISSFDLRRCEIAPVACFAWLFQDSSRQFLNGSLPLVHEEVRDSMRMKHFRIASFLLENNACFEFHAHRLRILFLVCFTTASTRGGPGLIPKSAQLGFDGSGLDAGSSCDEVGDRILLMPDEHSDSCSDDNHGCRSHPPPPLRMHDHRLDELRRVHHPDPALIAIRDVSDYGGAARIVEGAFDETAEVFGGGVGQ